MSEQAPEARERIRSHRFWAAVLGLPLTATLFIPWSLDGSELGAFDLAEAMEHIGWAVMPFVGVAFLIAAFAPMPPLARRGLLAASGVSALVLGSVLFGDERTRWVLPGEFADPRLSVLLLIWIVGAGLEMAMHARPRSRGTSVAALVGLTAVLFSFALPIRGRGSSQKSLLEGIVKGLEGRLREDALIAFVALFFVAVAWLQALRRVGNDRDKAARRRFRTSWIAYLLLPVPLLGLYAMLLWEAVGRPELLAEANNVLAFIFAGAFGGALGIANTATLLSGWKMPRWCRDAVIAGVAGAGIFLAIRTVLPDARERRAHALVDAIGEATVLGLRGQPVPERYLGGYAEFDLRAASSALEGHAPPGAVLRMIATAVHYNVRGDHARLHGWAVSVDGNLRWAGDTGAYGRQTDIEALNQVAPALVDLVGFAFDESRSCLPALSESERTSLGSMFDAENVILDETLCRESSDEALRIADDEPTAGVVDRYRVAVELPSGETRIFEGALLFESRLWIGPPAAVTR